jgi:NADH dehydrogenase
MAPLDVRDLGEALAVLCERGGDGRREVELGGSARRTMAEYLGALRAVHRNDPALRLPVPAFLARLGSHLCDLLHFSPFSYGHLELMRRDNLPRVNMLSTLICRTPTPVGADLPAGGSRLGVAGRIRFAARELLQ